MTPATNPHTAALRAKEALRACQDLFQQLRPEIERVAPGQKRRRMPKAAYELWHRLGELSVHMIDLRVALGDEKSFRFHPAAATAPTPKESPEAGNGAGEAAKSPGVEVIDLAKANYFWSGKEAYHYWCEAMRAEKDIPTTDDIRAAKGESARIALQSRAMAVRALCEKAKRELARYGDAISASPSKKDRCFENWPEWYVEKADYLDKWLARIQSLPIWSESPGAEVIKFSALRTRRARKPRTPKRPPGSLRGAL